MVSNAVVDTSVAEEMLDQIIGRLEDPDPLLRYMADKIADYETQAFATAGFGTWDPLDPDTIAAKGNSRILIDTGELLHGLTRATAGNTRISGDSVTLFTDEISAHFLRTGARGMPKRNATPPPPPSVVEGWADDLLEVLIDGRIR